VVDSRTARGTVSQYGFRRSALRLLLNYPGAERGAPFIIEHESTHTHIHKRLHLPN
jgi:hypothetical protein